jgi:sugar lactone lactonase YvrE
MHAHRWFFKLTLMVGSVAALAACGDDTQSTTTGTTTTTTGPGTGGMGGATTGTGGATTTGTGGAGGVGGMGGSGGTGGSTQNCENLPAGPIAPTVVLDNVFDGSEDFAFDGKGNIAAKIVNTIVLSDAQGQTTVLADLAGQAYGLRYRPDGVLVVARPGQGTVVEVAPDGTVNPNWVTGLNNPNGLYPDFDGNVWVTEFGAGNVNRINPDGTVDTIVTGVASPNGVVYDATRMMLFYTDYSNARIFRVDMSPGGNPIAAEVAVIINANPDGLVLDACGNLYVVDQGNSDLYRIKLDAMGVMTGNAELLASFDQNVANAQFGSGAGFDPTTLYVAGNPGTVYGVAVGVAGAPVPTPP